MKRRSDYRKVPVDARDEGGPLHLDGAILDLLDGPCAGYLAAPGFEAELEQELGDACGRHGRLCIAPGPPRDPVWALNVWRNPVRLPIASIGDAARQLKALQRNWAAYPVHLHRRCALIQSQLPHVSAKPLVFPASPPEVPLGSWTLLDKSTLLASSDCASPVPNGIYTFVEDHVNPPSRAYLKLYEALVREGELPRPGERCLDLGASPGGWTWVLAELGANVVAVDKAPIDAALAQRSNVSTQRESAFGLAPADFPYVKWLFSDIICYPKRLYDLVCRWQAESAVERIICSVKFQGATDVEIVEAFGQMPGSRLNHLWHNKHEVTFFWRR